MKNLSPAEQKIAELLARGLSDKRNSSSTFISPKTVSRHLANLRRRYQAPSAAALLCRLNPRPISAPGLTIRERAVFDLIRAGMNSRQIGLSLGISFTTVRRHRENMLLKNRCLSIRELTAKFLAAPDDDYD